MSLILLALLVIVLFGGAGVFVEALWWGVLIGIALLLIATFTD